MSPEGRHDAVGQAVQAAPSLAAILSWLLGMTVEKWLALAGIFFIALQAAGYIWRLRRDIRRESERRRSSLPPESDRADI
jgi:hypothetical protein